MHADVLKAINGQINSELNAWYTYLAMAGYCEREKFTGAAQWLRQQALEEYQHGMKLFNFVLARDGAVQLRTIDEPPAAYTSLADVFETALTHERRVTGQINALYELAFTTKSFAEMAELQWFIVEQVEEEKVAREWVAKFKLVGNDPGSILDLDRELGTRTSPTGGQ